MNARHELMPKHLVIYVHIHSVLHIENKAFYGTYTDLFLKKKRATPTTTITIAIPNNIAITIVETTVELMPLSSSFDVLLPKSGNPSTVRYVRTQILTQRIIP